MEMERDKYNFTKEILARWKVGNKWWKWRRWTEWKKGGKAEKNGI